MQELATTRVLLGECLLLAQRVGCRDATIWSRSEGGLNQSTQHFILKRRWSVW